MQNVDKYKELNDEIKIHEDWIDGFAKKGMELRVARQAIETHIKELENSWEAEKSKINKNLEAVNKLNLEKRQRDHQLQQVRQELEKRIHHDKLKALISQQPTFEEALRGQVEQFSAERMSGLSFEEPNDAPKISDGILERMGRIDFSIQTVDWRSAKGHYETVLKELCDAKLIGKQLTASDAHYRFEKILKCLKQQETILFS